MFSMNSEIVTALTILLWQLEYRRAALQVLTPEALAQIAEKAVADAESGDGSARRWLQAAGGSQRSGS